MKKLIAFWMFLLCAAICHAQGSAKGKIIDSATGEPMSYVNVSIFNRATQKFVTGAVTDDKGQFNIRQLAYGDYTLKLSYIGYTEVSRDFSVGEQHKHALFNDMHMTEDSQTLEEVTVTAQRPGMRLEVDRKSFDVSQDISNAGMAATDVLENIPSVEVDTDGNISLRGNTSVEVWINGKASGLTSDNRAEILQQIPSESIDRIEVIDNPSAKFSAEGSAGIINIVLKKNRTAGYYGSAQAGGNTNGSANVSGNINFNIGRWEGFANIGYRHRASEGGSTSYQEYLNTHQYQSYTTENDRNGNNLFARAGVTYNATDKDAFSLTGMTMFGSRKNGGITPYHYGTIGAENDSYIMLRNSSGHNDMRMLYGEFNYRHSFTDKHFLDFTVDYHNWRMDQENIYQDSTTYIDPTGPTEYDYQYRPMYNRNHSWEVKLDYENPIADGWLLQAGYQGNFDRENSPQESYIDETSWNGANAVEDEEYYNRFVYNQDLHAMYATVTTKFGKLGVMAGLRGEYWRINTSSYTYGQDHGTETPDKPFKKDFFQLFPSVFLSYQFDDSQQLQLNYTRRLRRPRGHQLNSFRNTRDASMISFGNPRLTPEYSNSFSLNYLKTWNANSVLVSAYYRPTDDVIQRINYQSTTDNQMYSTYMNVASSVSTGLELVMKNQLFKILNLTTTANAYYYKLNGFTYNIDGQTVTGESDDNFTWNARMQASLMLPFDISVQLTGRYRARQVITQGYRKANFSMNFGVRKTFLDRKLTLALNCRDILNSRKFENFTSSETFTRRQKNWGSGRTLNVTLTYSFGNMKAKAPKKKVNNSANMGGEDGGMESME